MGGYGSGRPCKSQKAEHFRSLNANVLRRAGALNPGWSGGWQWSNKNEIVARIDMRAHADAIILDYRFRVAGTNWETIVQSVALAFVACHYGGERAYFRCPGLAHGRPCDRRVSKLFAAGRYFLCRHCYRISYASQSEARHDRMLRRANKLRIALGGEMGMTHCLAPKPKGMWQQTYQQKQLEIEWCEDQADRAFISKFAHNLSED